jgi:uncharacterized membrane protein YqgA involved in biofilm formation
VLTSVATVLVGVWMIVEHNKLPDHTLSLIFGIIVGVLALVDLIRPYVGR